MSENKDNNLLNPWIIETDMFGGYAINLTLVNRETGERKDIVLDVNNINNLIENRDD